MNRQWCYLICIAKKKLRALCRYFFYVLLIFTHKRWVISYSTDKIQEAQHLICQCLFAVHAWSIAISILCKKMHSDRINVCPLAVMESFDAPFFCYIKNYMERKFSHILYSTKATNRQKIISAFKLFSSWISHNNANAKYASNIVINKWSARVSNDDDHRPNRLTFINFSSKH